MKFPQGYLITPILTLPLILTGCSGSGDYDEPKPDPDPVSKSFAATGPLIALSGNNIQVGTTSYDISGASVSKDDAASSAAELKSGMVITVSGSKTDQTTEVDSVDYENEVEGPIASIDPDNGSFVVLGLTILTNLDTVFDETSFDELMVGNVVEVSGYQSGENQIVATRVELKSEAYTDGDEIEVKGTISELDQDNTTFMLGLQAVDYSQATFDDIPNNQLSNGLYVEVESTVGFIDDVLIASEIEYEGDDHDHDEGDEVEIHGLINNFVSTTDFMVGGQAVTTHSATDYENGSSANLANGVTVEVEGEINADNVLVADEVEFKINSDIEIEARIAAIDSDTMTLTTLGLTITVNSLTLFENDSDGGDDNISFSDLMVNDFVEIAAYLDNDNLIAAKIELDDEEGDQAGISASIDSVDQPNLVMLGLTIVTNDSTEFENAAGESISADAFFAAIAAGDRIEVEGSYDGAVFTATSVEIDDD